MQRVFNGLLAGLAATIALSLLMELKTKMGVMPAVVFTEPQVATVGYSESDAYHGAGPGRSVAPRSNHEQLSCCAG